MSIIHKGQQLNIKFGDLYWYIASDTDIDIRKGCCIVKKIKRGTFYEDIDCDIRDSYIVSLTAVDYRTIEVCLIKGGV